MSKPHEGFTPPDFVGQTKILFVNEGNPAAMLVTNRAGRRRISSKEFPAADSALAWCRHNGAMMVYSPVALDRN